MIPFAVKIVFFCLSLSGTFFSGVILFAFAQVIGVWWLPVSYGVANLILQLAVCLGMIWKMDPYQMPHWFCVTQTAVVGLGAFLLTGVCTCFSVATATAVYQPSKIRDFSTLRWRPMYFLFMVVFPLLASAAQITVLLKLDAVKPTDDLHCDATNPIWVRFLGYAGASLVLSLPSFVISSMASWKLWNAPRMFSSQQGSRGRNPSSNFPQLSFRSAGNMTESMTTQEVYPQSPEPVKPQSAGAFLSKTPGVDTPGSNRPRFHLPFNMNASPAVSEYDSPISTNLPEFASSHHVGATVEIQIKTQTETYTTHDDVEAYSPVNHVHPSQTSVDAFSKVDHDFHDTKSPMYEEVQLKSKTQSYQMPQLSSSNRYSRAITGADLSSRSAPRFGPAIWRLLFFQVSFFFIEGLAALSTIIDVATHKKQPTPFGSQHVALILASWGPFVVFSHLPAVRKKVMNWFGR